jgi:MFS family permease
MSYARLPRKRASTVSVSGDSRSPCTVLAARNSSRWRRLAIHPTFMPGPVTTGLLLPLHVQALGLSAAWFGACGAALSVGVAGLAPALIDLKGRVGALVLAISTCALAIAGIGLCRWSPGLPMLFALLGLCLSVTQLVGQTHRMLAIPEAFRVRMAAAHLATAHLAAALAPALAGALLQHASVQAVYLLLAAGFAAGGLLLLLVPGLGPFLQLDHEGVRGWYGRHYPGAFTPRAVVPRVDA